MRKSLSNPNPTAINRRQLNPYGVGDISVNGDFKVCFKTSNDFTIQLLQFRILQRIP